VQNILNATFEVKPTDLNKVRVAVQKISSAIGDVPDTVNAKVVPIKKKRIEAIKRAIIDEPLANVISIERVRQILDGEEPTEDESPPMAFVTTRATRADVAGGYVTEQTISLAPATAQVDEPANDDVVAVDEATVREFLTIINEQAAHAIKAAGGSDRAGLVQLSRVFPDQKGIMPRRFKIGDIDAMTKTALNDAASGHNCYIEARTVRREVTGTNRGELEDSQWVFALVIDADNDKTKAAAVRAEPSLTVETSPGNFQYWYFVDKALPAGEGQEIGKLIREALTGADKGATGKPTQPYRLAGTINFPDAKKCSRGRYAVGVRVLEHTGKLYTADELREAFKVAPGDDAPDDSTHQDRSDFEARAWVKWEALDFDLQRLIMYGATGDDKDRSAEFFKVVAKLKRKFWPLDAIVALFEKYENGIACKYRGRIREETKRCWDKIESARDDLPTIVLADGRLTQIVAETEAALTKANAAVRARRRACASAQGRIRRD
jgi:hypothetical protein